MGKLIIAGGKKLRGEVTISGFKNSGLPILAGTLLADGKCTVKNLPLIEDIYSLKDIIVNMGGNISIDENGTFLVDSKKINNCVDKTEISAKIRASYYLLGVGLGKYKNVEMYLPGGCSIGSRPIDQHIKGFEALGAKVELSHGKIKCSADRLVGAEIFLDIISVGATINIIFAASMAEGVTVIKNAAKEPHIVDIANLINSMGGKVTGAGTDTIRITGVEKLHGTDHTVIPDQIEAGTYMIAAAATEGDILVKNVIPSHMESITSKLKEMGVEVVEFDDSIRIRGVKELKAVNINTQPYPGFPTDLQQPMTTLLTKAKGLSIINENMFEGRFKFIDELNRMGADIKVEGNTAIVKGEKKLTSAEVRATDLRAGASLIIAGLMSEGTTKINEPYHIYRGYQDIEKKLLNVGANIYKKNVEDSESKTS